MSLPKQVRQQIAEAHRIEDGIRAADAEAVKAAKALADSTTPPQPAPAPQPAVAAPVPPSTPQVDQKYEELSQQYRSLQGIHRTLVRTNGEQQSKMQGLQAQHEQLSSEVEKLRKQTATPVNTFAPITAEETKEFGPDLISVIERKAREVAAPLNQALSEANLKVENLATRNAELERQLNGVTHTQAQNATQAFEDRMRALVPNINVLNFDKNFLSWLSQVDPLDARRRSLQERLNEAVEQGEAEAAASYFKAYETLVAQAAAAAPKPTASLASQAQPVSRAAPDTQQQPAGKTWTQAEITSFYDGVTRGKYTPQEKARIEGDIYKAQRENRIAA